MIEAEILIQNQQGLHVRAASKFVKLAAKYRAHILVSRDDLEVNAKSIMGVLLLAAEEGATIKIKADGPDEKEAVDALQDLVNGRFGGEP